MRTDYAALLQFCYTEEQRKVVELCVNNTVAEAAARAGKNVRSVERMLARIRAIAALRGHAPEFDLTHPVAPGQFLRGASTYYNKDGKPAGQWVKSAAVDLALEERIKAMLAGIGDELKPYAPVKAPVRTRRPLLNLYPIADYHLNMFAWAEESGADWDLDLAECRLMRFFSQAVKQSPDARVGVFAQMGDFLHTDSHAALTPTNKHLLDVSVRFPQAVRAAVRCNRRIIEMLLRKHERVHIIHADANHDPSASVWLRETTADLYRREKRVTVDTSPASYYALQHGKTMLGFHHGHRRGPGNVDAVLAATFPKMFGECTKRYAFTGHLHSDRVIETPLFRVEQLRSLAESDAYATSSGYISGVDAKVYTFHEEFGMVGSLILCPEALQ